jgi:hypothetical protein
MFVERSSSLQRQCALPPFLPVSVTSHSLSVDIVVKAIIMIVFAAMLKHGQRKKRV